MKNMKMKTKCLLLSLCAFLFVGCEETDVEMPEATLDIEISTEFLNVQLESGESNQTIKFTAPSAWEVSLSDTTKASPDWITVSPMSGIAGDIVLYLTASENLSLDSRSASITIITDNDQVDVSVVQAAAAEYLTLDKSEENVDYQEGSFEVNVISNAEWTIDQTSDWITLSPEEGSGDETVSVSYAENSDIESRTAVIIFKSNDVEQSLTITQSGISPSFTIDTTLESIDCQAGSFEVVVSSNTEWMIGETPDWITANLESGSGDQNITFSYDENINFESRSAEITFTCYDITATLIINQEAKDIDWANIEFNKRTICLQFTATWCGYCPRAISLIHNYKELYGDDDVVFVAAHGSDVMSNVYSSNLISQMGITGFPSIYYGSFITSNAYIYWSETSINSAMQTTGDIGKQGVATAIYAESAVDDSTVDISAVIAVQTSGEYGVGAMILEDNITASQSCYYSTAQLAYWGMSDYDFSNHYNVLQGQYPADSNLYVSLGDVAEQTANSVHNFNCSFNISDLTSLSDIDNCRIVVYTYNLATGYIDNVIQAPIGTVRDFDTK